MRSLSLSISGLHPASCHQRAYTTAFHIAGAGVPHRVQSAARYWQSQNCAKQSQVMRNSPLSYSALLQLAVSLQEIPGLTFGLFNKGNTTKCSVY